LAETVGIDYSVNPEAPYVPGQTVTVTAELQAGYEWGVIPGDWDEVDSTTATFTVTFDANPCQPVVPGQPDVTQAVCVDGVLVPPVLDLPDDTAAISYEADPPAPYAAGQTVTITATLAPEGVEWGDLTGTGWTPTSTTTATFSITFLTVECEEVTPVAPTVTPAVCVGGEFTAPTLTLPDDTAQVSYEVSAPEPYSIGQTVTVTATLAPTGVAWPDELPAGWIEQTPTTATFSVTFTGEDCVPVLPAVPQVTEAVCVGGQLTPPQLDVPEDTEVITYEADADPVYAPGQTVVVTATLIADGVEWGDLESAGWERVSATVATFTVVFAEVECEEVMPIAPTVEQSECVAGKATEPMLTLATGPEGVTYEVDIEAPYEPGDVVLVTATLSDGQAWGAMPAGWDQLSLTQATYEVVFGEYPCEPASPVEPIVDEAVCVGGELFPPMLTVPDSEGIVYTVDAEAPYAPGQTVTVTADLEQGFEWGEVGEGWEIVSSTRATFTVTFAEVECEQVMPVSPTVTQSVCPEGQPTAPTVVLADDTEAIWYLALPEGPYAPGDEVLVVAVLEDGFAWADDMTAGWEVVDPMTAVFVVELAGDPCIPVGPAAPTVTQSQCPDGTVTRPTLTLPTTAGVAYTVSPADPYSGGQTVTVTAVLEDGYAWEMPLPAGWTLNSPAAYTVTFAADAECPKTPDKAPPLAKTGASDVGTFVGLAVVAMLLGGLLLFVARRRDVMS
ncbi:LPXTG cell wall anchor domain-containing protein, partial [Isoptericola variabilis]